ncbi:hypothetical protein ACJD0Z_03360 [Flavobacteriaceae bacterium M23B6Z8]
MSEFIIRAFSFDTEELQKINEIISNELGENINIEASQSNLYNDESQQDFMELVPLVHWLLSTTTEVSVSVLANLIADKINELLPDKEKPVKIEDKSEIVTVKITEKKRKKNITIIVEKKSTKWGNL